MQTMQKKKKACKKHRCGRKRNGTRKNRRKKRNIYATNANNTEKEEGCTKTTDAVKKYEEAELSQKVLLMIEHVEIMEKEYENKLL